MTFLGALLLGGLPFHAELVRVDPRALRAEAGLALAEPERLLPPPGGEIARTSGPLRGTRPFRDVLPSWNVDAQFDHEGRAGRRVDPEGAGAFGPWMHVGDWGDPALVPPRSARVVSGPDGEVAVDVFEGQRTFAAVELRLRAFARAALASAEGDAEGDVEGDVDRARQRAVVVRRLTLALRDRDATVAPRPLGASRPLGRLLDVQPRSQRTERAEIAGRICSPTSVAMVLGFRGVDVATLSVAERAYDAAHDLYGVWPRNVQAAWSFGVPGHVACFADWADIEDAITAGTPLVISLAAKPGELRGAPYPSTPGHLIVLCGFDSAGDCTVIDPAVSDPAQARRTYARSDLETVWLHRGGVAYVLEARPTGDTDPVR